MGIFAIQNPETQETSLFLITFFDDETLFLNIPHHFNPDFSPLAFSHFASRRAVIRQSLT